MLPYIWATDGWMLIPSFVAAGVVAAGADLAGRLDLGVGRGDRGASTPLVRRGEDRRGAKQQRRKRYAAREVE
jgi:hypothetical protein